MSNIRSNRFIKSGLYSSAGRRGLSPSTMLYMTAMRLVPGNARRRVQSSYKTTPSDLEGSEMKGGGKFEIYFPLPDV